ncbi:MAG: hypothetical protein R2873_30535 [Caldilineaceae bacterium]
MSTEYIFRASISICRTEASSPPAAEGQVQKTYRWDSNVPGTLTDLTVSCRLTEPPANRFKPALICDVAANCALTRRSIQAPGRGFVPRLVGVTRCS